MTRHPSWDSLPERTSPTAPRPPLTVRSPWSLTSHHSSHTPSPKWTRVGCFEAPWKLLGRAPRRKGLGPLGPPLPHFCTAPRDDSHPRLTLNMAMDGVGGQVGRHAAEHIGSAVSQSCETGSAHICRAPDLHLALSTCHLTALTVVVTIPPFPKEDLRLPCIAPKAGPYPERCSHLGPSPKSPLVLKRSGSNLEGPKLPCLRPS